MKDYCTQNNGDCGTCSLVNYGMDCRNVPLSARALQPKTKITRAIAMYNGSKGTQTVQAVLEQIPGELKLTLTGKQLGLVMSVVNKAYHNGKASCGCEVIDGEMVWINKLSRMFSLDALGGILHCQRCQHDWRPDTNQLPKVCPKCKTPYWNKPRRDTKVEV